MNKLALLTLTLILSLASCSSNTEIEPLDEDLVFSEETEDEIADLDFGEGADDLDDLSMDEFDGNDLDLEDSKNSDLESLDFGDGDEFALDEKQDLEDSVDFDDFSDEDLSESSGGEDLSFDDFSDEGSTSSDSLGFDDFSDEDLSGSSSEESLSFDDFDQPSQETEEAFSADHLFGQAPPVQTPYKAPEEESFETPMEVDTFSFDEPDSNVDGSQITSIDYNALQKGGSFVISTTAAPQFETEFIPETNQYILKLKGSQISKQLLRPFLTKDFRQSFEAMNSYRGEDGSVKFVFQLKKGSYPKVSRVENKFLVEPGFKYNPGITSALAGKPSLQGAQAQVLSATSFEDFLSGNGTFVGEPISIQVKDEDVVTIIQFISEEVGANIVVSDSVKGKLSIKLKEVPWDQALVSIMKMKGLGYVRNGNILRVAPLEDLKKESLAAAEVQRTRKTLSPFHVKVFPLSYAKPQTIEQKVKPFLTASSGQGSRVGQIISEERSSSLIVRDTAEVISNIATLIRELDRPPLQVMIQAKIVEASKNFSREISSAFRASPSSTAQGGETSVRGSLPWNFNQSTKSAFVPEVTIGGINFLGTLTQRIRLQELENKAKILSAPSVLAINNEKAVILQSDEILNPVITVNQNGNQTQTIEKNPAELKLEVTPQVSSDGNIIMDIAVKREFPSKEELGVAKKTREANTKVIIGNNNTAMIGGIYQVLENRSEAGIPLVRKIPLLKWLFGARSYSKIDTELIVFVTPRVVETGLIKNQLGQEEGLSAPSASEGFSHL